MYVCMYVVTYGNPLICIMLSTSFGRFTLRPNAQSGHNVLSQATHRRIFSSLKYPAALWLGTGVAADNVRIFNLSTQFKTPLRCHCTICLDTTTFSFLNLTALHSDCACLFAVFYVWQHHYRHHHHQCAHLRCPISNVCTHTRTHTYTHTCVCVLR